MKHLQKEKQITSNFALSFSKTETVLFHLTNSEEPFTSGLTRSSEAVMVCHCNVNGVSGGRDCSLASREIVLYIFNLTFK